VRPLLAARSSDCAQGFWEIMLGHRWSARTFRLGTGASSALSARARTVLPPANLLAAWAGLSARVPAISYRPGLAYTRSLRSADAKFWHHLRRGADSEGQQE